MKPQRFNDQLAVAMQEAISKKVGSDLENFLKTYKPPTINGKIIVSYPYSRCIVAPVIEEKQEARDGSGT